MYDFGKVLGAAIAILGVTVLLSLVLCLPIMWLWNWLCPALFGLPAITWIQAWGLNILCGFLFRAKVDVNHKS